MKTILVHLEISAVLDSILHSSLLVARRFDSHIEGLHVRPSQPDVIAAGADGFIAAAPDLVAGFERDARDRAERAHVAFERFMETNGLARFADPAQPGPTADWRIETTGQHGALGSRGRVFDLIAVGRPLKDSIAPSMAALESALFESGRPLLVAPPKPPAVLGEHIVIAWNCSVETARTVAFSMPFLTRASRVTVLTVAKAVVAGPSGAELAACLQRNGIAAECVDIPSDERSSGVATLDEVRKLGADLVIKGAYTQSRLRQMIFGGTTSHMLAECDVPMIMAN